MSRGAVGWRMPNNRPCLSRSNGSTRLRATPFPSTRSPPLQARWCLPTSAPSCLWTTQALTSCWACCPSRASCCAWAPRCGQQVVGLAVGGWAVTSRTVHVSTLLDPLHFLGAGAHAWCFQPAKLTLLCLLGLQVVLVANSLPAINDITAAELRSVSAVGSGCCAAELCLQLSRLTTAPACVSCRPACTEPLTCNSQCCRWWPKQQRCAPSSELPATLPWRPRRPTTAVSHLCQVRQARRSGWVDVGVGGAVLRRCLSNPSMELAQSTCSEKAAHCFVYSVPCLQATTAPHARPAQM